jgi:hypothetical protein
VLSEIGAERGIIGLRMVNGRHILMCKNNDCLHPIVLPCSIPSGTSRHQVPWPTDAKPRNFLCRTCKHVYEYTIEDVRPGLDERQDQERADHDDIVFCIEAGCAGQNCEAQVRILAIGSLGSDRLEIRHFWLHNAIYETARCLEGRPCPGILAGSISAVQIDQEWES